MELINILILWFSLSKLQRESYFEIRIKYKNFQQTLLLKYFENNFEKVLKQAFKKTLKNNLPTKI